MILSILICSLKERHSQLASLLFNLMNQLKNHHYIGVESYPVEGMEFKKYSWEDVEILVLSDEKQMTTGGKRNILYANASGEYSVSVDDDDEVPAYYIVELLAAAKSNADCFAINGKITTDGIDEKKWFISKDNPYQSVEKNGVVTYLRYPNHITAIKTEITKKFRFPNQVFAEDYIWATAIHNSKEIKTEHRIEKPMYHYKFKTKK